MASPDRLPANFDFSKPVNVAPDKLPANFNFGDVPPDYNPAPAFKASPMQDFFGTIAEDAGNLIPGTARSIIQTIRHPYQSLDEWGHNLSNLPETLADEYKVSPGRAIAHSVELGAPIVLHGLGNLMERSAPTLAETAMHVGKRERLTEANPGRALINETGAVRPASIARDLNAKAASLGKTEEQMAAASPNTGSLSPAIAPIAAKRAKALGAGATTTAEQLVPMRDYFAGEAPAGFSGNTVPGPNGTTLIAPDQPASQLLSMRREFTPNFRIHYGPQADSTIQKVGRQAYAGLTGEVKNAVPGIAEIDDRLHDIIPAAKAAESTSRNAGFLQRSAGRIAAHTGALMGAVGGYHYGGPGGAMLGLALPELAASPTAQMIAARSLYNFGRGLQAPSLMGPATMASHPLVRVRSADEQQK